MAWLDMLSVRAPAIFLYFFIPKRKLMSQNHEDGTALFMDSGVEQSAKGGERRDITLNLQTFLNHYHLRHSGAGQYRRLAFARFVIRHSIIR